LDSKILTILTLIGTFFGPLLIALIISPIIVFDVNYKIIGNETDSIIKISNIGFSPATNVIITINPDRDIIKSSSPYHTDKITINNNGPLSHVAEMERLSNSQQVVIATSHNTTSKSLDFLKVVVTHDKGSATYEKSKFTSFNNLSIAFFISAILTIIAAILINFTKFKRNGASSKDNSKPKDPPSKPSTNPGTSKQTKNVGIIPDLQARLSSLEIKFTDLTKQLGMNPELIENKKLSISHEKTIEINSILTEAKEIKNKFNNENISIPINIELQLLIATYNYHIDNLEKSLKYLEDILEQDPNNWIALLNKGVILSDMNKNDDALSCYEKALEINPNNPIILNNLATLLTDHFGEYEKAIYYLDIALKLHPKFLFTHYHKGNALFYLKKYKESEEFADIALQSTPNDPSVLCLKGICVGMLRDPQESIKFFDKALENDPKFFFALTNKASSLAKLNRFEEALENVEKALKIKPNDSNALKNKAFISKKLDSKS
jgi:tetratricopeptide (TPR) repeat protein